MKHFDFFDDKLKETLFYVQPEEFNCSEERQLLGTVLGATLYSPATRKTLSTDVVKAAKNGSTSLIICLEDSVPDARLEEAEQNLVANMKIIDGLSQSELPLLFVRPRNPQHLQFVLESILPYIKNITGFCLPKFDTSNAEAFLTIIAEYSELAGKHLYAMPILESPLMIYSETRSGELQYVYEVCHKYRDHVLNMRIGATDMSSPYGLRRSRDLNIYDVKLVASVISDIVNRFGRVEDGYTISGPVWEHFTDRERLFKPRLRQSPFDNHKASNLRAQLIMEDSDVLIREIELDRANGLWGKTVIHPTHVLIVNSMMVVSKEEYSDAQDILSENDGAIASIYRNKMNEIKPHTAWAHKTMLRAKAFGVANEGITFVDFLEAGIK